MRFAVFSSDDDFHAAAVTWALRRRGIDARHIFFSNCAAGPDRVSLKWSGKLSLTLQQGDECIDLTAFDGYWLRREGCPSLPQELHKADVEFAEKDWRTLIRSMHVMLSVSGKYCLNPPSAYYFDKGKPYQLEQASRMGFRIPTTYVGNNVDDMRALFTGSKEVAVKSLSPHYWWRERHETSQEYLYTSLASLSRNWEGFELEPIIVQEYLSKSIEVRVTVIGQTIFAVGIDSQAHPDTRIDWRIYKKNKGGVTFKLLDEVPTSIRALILQYCSVNGLQFCAFDFIVTPEGEWFFLEANHHGQFLFCEAYEPRARLLEAVTSHIVAEMAPDAKFGEPSVSLVEFRKSNEGQRFTDLWRKRSGIRGIRRNS